MGCWHETCGLTNLPITDGDPIRLMIIRRIPSDSDKSRRGDGALFYAFDLYQPVTILAKGKYNDYGWIDFDEGEEERLYESANLVGVSFTKEENSNPVFPPHHHQWMISEEAFQMLDAFPLDAWGDKPKTVGDAIKFKRKRFFELCDKEDDSAVDREQMNRLFETGEMPYWPLKSALYRERWGRDISMPNDPQKIEALFDIFRLFLGLNTLRKTLAPTIGAGSQTYSDEAYVIVSQFMRDHVKRWTSKYDEEYEEDDPEATPA